MPALSDNAVRLRVRVRPPLRTEWQACRALIPEAFASPNPPEALLAFDDSTGAALGCATFRKNERSIIDLHVRVLRNWRRLGIGRALIEAIVQLGAPEIHVSGDIQAMPGAEPFLTAMGFVPRNRVLTVEAQKEPLYNYIQRLLERGGRTDGKERCIASIEDVAREALAKLYTTLVVPELGLPPGAAAPLVWDPRFAHSPVLLCDGEPKGMLLMEANNGKNVCHIVARAVAPECQRGGWANLRLLAEGFERGSRQGSVRMRFEAPADNPDTVKLMARARGEIKGVRAWFVRSI